MTLPLYQTLCKCIATITTIYGVPQETTLLADQWIATLGIAPLGERDAGVLTPLNVGTRAHAMIAILGQTGWEQVGTALVVMLAQGLSIIQFPRTTVVLMQRAGWMVLIQTQVKGWLAGKPALTLIALFIALLMF